MLLLVLLNLVIIRKSKHLKRLWRFNFRLNSTYIMNKNSALTYERRTPLSEICNFKYVRLLLKEFYGRQYKFYKNTTWNIAGPGQSFRLTPNYLCCTVNYQLELKLFSAGRIVELDNYLQCVISVFVVYLRKLDIYCNKSLSAQIIIST